MGSPQETDTHCPGCGKAVDVLRAGHVAIISGRFRYYCNQECKTAHLMAIAREVVGDDVVTAEPPP